MMQEYGYIMSTNDDKYLVLRGKNKDIYFIQKRLSKDISKIMGKEFIKKSLETTDIHIARQKRDKIIEELEQIVLNSSLNQENMHYSSEIYNVPIEKESINTLKNDILENNSKTKNDKFAIFSLKIPNKEDLIENIDKFIPIGIVILTLFIAFIA
tara:strand:+ start:846 stop:1310 length:465 start_codon:yes stop_codon:yes gene_type:complete